MSGLEPIIAAEVAGPAIAAEVTAASAINAALAEAAIAEAALGEAALSTAATEIASQGPLQAAINESITQANLLDSANLYSKMGMTDPFEFAMRAGIDADMPGATMRSIQAGLQNAPLNTIGSLPQYLGAPAMPGGTQALQAAKLIGPGQQGQRTAYSPPMMNRGREVTLAAPVQSLLEAQPMRRRKDMLSLI